MPVDNKYETVIKPNFEQIRKLKSSGATDKDIYTALKVSSAVWYKAKKENKEFKELLNNKETIKSNLEREQEILDRLPTNAMFLEKIAEKSYYDDNASMDVLLKGHRHIRKESNHYLQLEYEKLDIERERLELEREKMEMNNNNMKSQVEVGSDLINMILTVADPHKFRE